MIQTADLSWRDQTIPISTLFDDPYFSLKNGLEESRYVFLKNSHLPQRWQNHLGTFSIIETGFGTGLNFLATWQAFDQYRQAHPDQNLQLHFTSIEKYPLSQQQLRQAINAWPELQPWAELLCEDYHDPIAGVRHLSWPQYGVSLTLYFMDVADAVEQLRGPVHAWYLDGFTPAKNPDMWSPELFVAMNRLGQETICTATNINPTQDYPITTVATFTAASQVRRALQGSGYSIIKQPGFGKKRELLTGYFNSCQGPTRLNPRHWLDRYDGHQPSTPLRTTTLPSSRPVSVVIGGGLAGCHSARALANTGHKVTVIDSLGIAGGASGNPQGGLYVKLAAHEQATHTEFYRQAYEYSLQQVAQTLGPGTSDNDGWQQCGVLQLAYNDKEAKRQQQYLTIQQPPASLVYAITPHQAQQLAGSSNLTGGLFFPAAGWVNPKAWCQALVQQSLPNSASSSQNQTGEKEIDSVNPSIDIRQLELLSVSPAADRRWILEYSDGSQQTADHIVFATAWQTQQLLNNVYLPSKKIRGQLTYCDPDAAPTLPTVLCGKHYAAPANNGRLCIGATYDQHSHETGLRHDDQLQNIEHWQEFGDAWSALTEPQHLIGGRVSFRCTTPDYLPIVGPCVDSDQFLQQFYSLAKNAKRWPESKIPTLAGLWLNIGHGSRGLASAPLSAAILAAQINRSPLPCPADVANALQPVRFITRDTIRRKLPDNLQQQVDQYLKNE